MANRYADDIRRIVGKDDVDGSLAPAKDRERIPGGRGIAYNTASGIGSSSGFSPTGGGTGVPSGSSTYNPDGTEETDSYGSEGESRGGTSAGRDSAFDPSNPYDLISQFGDTTDVNEAMNNWTFNSPDALKVVTGLDPVTGTEIDIYLGPLSYPPPEGWEDPNVPPGTGPDPTWQLGYYWETGSANAPDKYQSARIAADEVVSGINDNPNGNVFQESDFYQANPSEYYVCLQQVVDNGNPIPPGPEFCIIIFRNACSAGDPAGPGDYCSTVPPEVGDPDFWPPIDKIIMDLDNGIASVNEYQNPTDLDGFTQAGASKVNLESAENPGTFYSVEPTGTGGTLIYETVGAGGPPTGVYKTFDSTGRFTGYGDVTSIDYVRPDSQ